MSSNKLYSIFDVKSQSYSNVFSCLTDGISERIFTQIIASGNNPDYLNYPADFCLYCVGEFDQNSGIVTSEPPRMVINAISIVERLGGFRGAAVGGLPLKSQSASKVDGSDAFDSDKTACDDSEASFSKSNNRE